MRRRTGTAKAPALLVYLAMAPRACAAGTRSSPYSGPSDAEHGRSALSQAIRYLPVHAGGAIISQGEEISTRFILCDAVEFRNRVESGEPASALAVIAAS
jgi:hypothetical protein